jgi:putative cardiolipin synthase
MDRERVFVGSFNFDQRSAHLNTEIGFIIESPELACASADAFIARIPPCAYEVRLCGRKLLWVERDEGTEVIHDREPGTTLWQRAAVGLLSWLPIEWML